MTNKEKMYLVSEGELEYLLNYISNEGTQKMIKSLIKSKTPAKVIVSGKVGYITLKSIDRTHYEVFNIGEASFNGVIKEILEGYKNKSGTLFWVQDKEE
ncbi:MAG: hypothetical protein PVJ67_04135 [Candidatus Pacearchaeota archaeon]|jgi:hypothetical protein